MEYLVEIIGGLILLILGWNKMEIVRLNQRVNDLDAKKMNAEEFQEVKNDVKDILKTLTELKVEQALWQGRQEQINSKKPG